MPHPRFYLISDRRRMGADPAAALAELLRAGLPAFQWREKDLPPMEGYRFLRPLVDAGHASRILVNDRIDLAAALGVGVHLPEMGLPTKVARALLPAGTWVGRSTHSAEAALRARDEGADFVTFGPVFDTASKRPYGPPQGTGALRAAAGALGAFPVLALGGVTLDRVAACLEAGAAGVAAIGAVWDAPDPVEAYLSFARALGIDVPPQ